MSFHLVAARMWAAGLAIAWMAGAATAQGASAPEALKLGDAIARALTGAPALEAAGLGLAAAEAGVRQADRRINPTLDLDVENAAGWSAYQWLGRAETTLSLSQTLERGGDRAARTALARTGAKAAQADGEQRRQDLVFAVERAFIAAQVAAADRAAADERVVASREIVATVQRRVDVARDPLMAASRAQARLVEAEIAAESARLVDEAARRELASHWGGEAGFVVDMSAFGAMAGDAKPGAAASPEIVRAQAEEERAGAAIAVERARARPDTTVSAGVRYFHEYDEAALVVGVSIPLAAWDNNSAAIERAEAERSKARFETEALRRGVEREAAAQASQMEIARAEVDAVDARLLPAVGQALQRARDGYAAGAFSYLDVLDAQRALADAQRQRNSALGSYHRARAALARLTGAYAGVAPDGEISR